MTPLKLDAKIFCVVGEPSGDRLGARLLAGLKKLGHHGEISGIGGDLMAAEGLASLFPMQDMAVMGLTEILPRLPLLKRRIDQTIAAIEVGQPDILVTIDAPDFGLRVARAVRRRGKCPGLKMVHYVAPSVWAWRPKRAEKLAKIVDRVLCLLPFEPPYFTRHGLDARFVGHPILRDFPASGDKAAACAALGLDASRPVLLLLPGSRSGEIARIAPRCFAAAQKITQQMPDIQVIVPTLPHLAEAIRMIAAEHGIMPDIRLAESDKHGAFQAATVALAASGTVTLELAQSGVSSVVAYALSPVTWFFARRLVRLKWVSLPNILAQSEIFPEFLQGAATDDALATAVLLRLQNPAMRDEIAVKLGQVMAMLRPDDAEPELAAAYGVLSVL